MQIKTITEFNQPILDQVMQIWLAGNLAAHSFIDSQYWRDAFVGVEAAIKDANVIVAEDSSGKIIGFIGLVDNYVAGLFVSENKQGSGVGTQLLKAAQAQIPQLTLDVYQKNDRAVTFYQRQGYQITKSGIDSDTGELEYRMTNQK